MNQYYLIPKQIIDSRIEELQKASEKYYTQNHLGMQNATNDIINLLQSLTQQSELVEVTTKELITNEGYFKVIKTITK